MMNGRTRSVSVTLLILVGLLGSPIRPSAQFFPGSTVTFSQQTAGTSGQEVLVALVRHFPGSTGTVDFDITGDFRRGPSSTCPTVPSTLSADCNFYVVFAPTQLGTRNGQLILHTTGCVPFGCADQNWNLTGNGLALPAPSQLTAVANSSSQITLSWAYSSNAATGFSIYQSTNNSTFTRIATTSASARSYPKGGLGSSTTYYYRVLASNSSVSSGFSNTAFATTTTSPCDVNGDRQFNVLDVQIVVNQAIGVAPATSDVNRDGVVNVLDVQLVVNAAIGLGCRFQ